MSSRKLTSGEAHDLCGAEGFLVKLDRLRRAGADEVWSHRVHAIRHGFDWSGLLRWSFRLGCRGFHVLEWVELSDADDAFT